MNTTEHIFTGVELEGPYIGKLALYIPFSISEAHAEYVVCMNPVKWEVVYIGAGQDRGFPEWLISKVDTWFSPDTIIIVEVDKDSISTLDNIPTSLLNRMEIVYVEKLPSLYPINHFKQETPERLSWSTCKFVGSLSLDHPGYKEDKILPYAAN